MTNNGNK